MGLGYVGLPLSLLFARKGVNVIGFDNSEERIKILKEGKSPIRYIDHNQVREVVSSKKLVVTNDFRQLKKATAVLICVPTPLTAQKEPDLSYVVSAAQLIANHATPGVLVILESTTYPGTTRDVIIPIFEQKGWKAGSDVYFAYSPEREDPANTSFQTENIPRLVGGYDKKSLERAVDLYEQVLDQVVPMSTMEAAEAAKLLENIFRSVNIAMVNELKMVFDRMGIDIWEVIKERAPSPSGLCRFTLGPG